MAIMGLARQHESARCVANCTEARSDTGGFCQPGLFEDDGADSGPDGTWLLSVIGIQRQAHEVAATAMGLIARQYATALQCCWPRGLLAGGYDSVAMTCSSV